MSKNRKQSSSRVVRRGGSRGQNNRPLGFEPLEDRRLLASVIVGESTFDPEVFGQNISSALDFNIVGYAYAVNHNGNAVVSAGTGGLYGPDEGRARTLADSPETVFETGTRIEINSVSKIITTVAVLHLLESEYDDLDAMLSTPISQFLPADWTIGTNVDLITVRHLLTHTSGWVEDSSNAIGVNFEGFGNNNFQNLRALVAADLGTPTGTLPGGSPAFARSYSNANFSLLAKMIPYMPPDDGVREFLDAISLNFPESADAIFGSLYSQYVQDNILTPSGIVNPTMNVTGENPALGYVFADVAEDVESAAGRAQNDYTDVGGAFGWKLSAPELAHFMNTLRHTNTLLSDTARGLMNSEDFLLGWAPSSASGTNPYVLSPLQDAFGTYYTHGGAGRGFRSEIVMFPGDIDVALAMNSFQSDDAFPEGIGDRFEFLRFAYSNAWTDLVIQGDSNSNSFELRLNAIDPNLLDLVVDDEPFLSFRIDVLHSLELRGLGGDDTFFVDGLPHNIEVVLQGGTGNDLFTVLDTDIGVVQGDVTIDGGEGADSLVFNEGWVFGAATYTITDGTTAKSSRVGQIHYNRLEELTVHGGNSDDAMCVYSTGSGVSVRVFGNAGDDTIEGGPAADLLDGGDGSDTIQGGSGNDTIYGRAGADFIGGWLGDDLILCGEGNDIASGDDGNDIVVGEAGNDLVAGGAGNDTVTGGSGNDILVGGLFSAGASVVAETGDDSLDGSDDADTLFGDSWALGAPLDFGFLGGDDTIQGGPGNDTIYGQAGADFIGGWLGDDLIFGGRGNDIASGDQGNDGVHGESGNDLVAGGDGNDTVTGGSGDDILVGGLFSAGAAVVAETGDDLLEGGSGADTLFGDSWALGAPLDFGVIGGNDTLRGGTGNDLVVGQSGNDALAGGAGNDTLLGTDGNDLIRGGGGDDQVWGGNGHDLLLGEGGNDALTGGDGRDVLIGGLNADTLDGGADDDILIAGTTSFDNDNAALDQIMAEWTSARSYQSRVKNLKGIGNGPDFANRLNGNVFLKTNGRNATVFDDLDSDTLTGSLGDDWFFYDPAVDQLMDWVPGEKKN